MATLDAQVSFDRLQRADSEPHNWLTYSGTAFNQRHSLLTQVTPANVKNLELQWIWQAHSLEKFEATALARIEGVGLTAPQKLDGDAALEPAVAGLVDRTHAAQT